MLGSTKGVELLVMWQNGRDAKAVPLLVGSVRIPHANFFLSDIRKVLVLSARMNNALGVFYTRILSTFARYAYANNESVVGS